MEKFGMEQEGLLKEQVLKDGNYEDLFYYGIINPHEEWFKKLLYNGA